MYVNFVFISFFIGYAVGTAPIFSFHYGAGNADELRNLRKKSVRLLTVTGVVMILLSEALSWPLTAIFVGYDAELYAMTVRGFRLYTISYLLCGFNIYGQELS